MPRFGQLTVRALLWLTLLLGCVTSEAQMTTGTYVGDGTVGRKITGLGFRPDVVIVKGNDSDGTFTPTSTIIRTSTMVGDSSKPMVLDNALVGNEVQSLDVDGFTVGSARRVNQTGITFYWSAFKVDADMKVGTYTGNGGAQSITALGFSPEYVVVMSSTNRRAVQAVSAAPVGRSFEFESAAWLASQITSLDPTGFSVVHNGAAPYADESPVVYHYVAWNDAPLKTKVGSYPGNATDNRNITGVGFQPEYLIAKAIYDNNVGPAATPPPNQRYAQMVGDAAYNFSVGPVADHLQAFQIDGFQIGAGLSINRTFADCNLDGPGCTYFYVAFNLQAPDCPPLGTNQGGSTLTVTAPNSFEMTWDTVAGGGIRFSYDLAEDPTRTYDLAAGIGSNGTLVVHGIGIGGVSHDVDNNTLGAKLSLLEATPTRVRVRQEAFYQQDATTNFVTGAKAFGDYSIYPSGRMALRWARRTTADVIATSEAINMGVHLTGAGPLSNLTRYSESGLAYVPQDDFSLFQREIAGVRTDFLNITYRDWTIADGYLQDADVMAALTNGPDESALLTRRENVPASRTIPAGTEEVWNFLTYFKPTNFIDHLDPAVTARRDDYRPRTACPTCGPDPLTFGVGSAWNDPSENTASDDFNESEAAYTLTFNPAAGLTFDIDGGTTTRYHPFFKIRQWRSLQDPSTVTLEGVALANDVDYRADVKPVARAQFAQGLNWHSTFENAAAVTGPDIGTAGTVNGTTSFVPTVPNRYGQAALFDAVGENVTFPSAGNFNLFQGTLEFWYQPRYNHTDAVRHVLWHNEGSATRYFLLEKSAGNALIFSIRNGGTTTSVTVTSANFSWRAYDWVHLRVSWYEGGAVGAQARLFLNGVEPPHTDAGTFSSTGMSAGTNYVGSDSAGNNSALGIVDELHLYVGPELTDLAHGGLIGHPSEWLADGTYNMVLSLVAVSATQQGAYLYLGADAKFRGLNVALWLPGTGLAVLQWQFWNGIGWVNLPGLTDETNNLTQTGTIYWTADPPGWSPYSINGGPDLYHVRAYVVSGAYIDLPVEGIIKTDILLFQYCGDITLDSRTFAFGLPTPTAVELSRFEARGGNRAVELVWETTSELNNLGFHLYRATSEGGPYERITPSPIPGLGSSPAGAAYRYLDRAVVNGETYYYQLEDIDTNGKTDRHGPVWAAPTEGSVESFGEENPTRITYGEPWKTALSIRRETAGRAVLQLVTGGFYAEPAEDGAFQVLIPGLEEPPDGGGSSLPVKRFWLDAVAGRGFRILSVRAEEVERFQTFQPVARSTVELRASRTGTVRALRRRGSGGLRSERLTPEVWARVLSVAFQGERKKAFLELAPVKWDGASGELVLARRLTVEISFQEKDSFEETTDGIRGRRTRRTKERYQTEGVVARLVARERGLYAVRFEEVFSRRRRAVAATTLRLSRLGETVPFHLEPKGNQFGPGARLFFLSPGAEANPYGDEMVYELEFARTGETMIEAAAAPRGQTVPFYWHTLRLEQNRYYQAALTDAPDLWLWDLVFAPAVKSFPFTVKDPATTDEPGRLSVWLQGASDFPVSPDHHVRVYVNGTSVEEIAWEGKEARKVDAELPHGVLRAGENVLEIENVGDTGAQYSMVMFDRFDVTYPRMALAEEGALEGRFGLSGLADISGVAPAPVVLDVTGDEPRWLTGIQSGPTDSVRFGVETARSYLAVSANAILRPEVRRVPRSELTSEHNRADYLLIAPQEFLPAAKPLLDLRRAQGLSVKAVSLESLYSEFGFGESSPQAIRDFLAYAYSRWRRPSPRYVLLVGDATYDFKDYLKTGVKNRVPPLMVKTGYLWTASDPSYAAVNGDDILPDLAIGRLPAATVVEVQAIVGKIVAYERGAVGLEQAPVVLVADNPDRAGNFVADTDGLATTVLLGRDVRKIYVNELGGATRNEIVAAFDEGASLMSYVGHGGIHLWADENIFNTGDVSSLTPQSQQPVLLTMNCLNGYFLFPYFNSLAEELLKAKDKGAIAAFSPSGLSVNEHAHRYHRALLAELLSRRHERLGDAILAAQEAYMGTGVLPELLTIYHLLGDPALRLLRR